MKEIKGDIFDFINQNDVDAICITTNGIVNSAGFACMGAGTAGEAANRWQPIRKIAGNQIKTNGNVPSILGSIDKNGKYQITYENYKCLIISFPTKEHFKNPAIPKLIRQSSEKLVEIANNLDLKKIIIPAPGVGAFTGKLSYDKDVKPMIQDILDNRFFITFLDGK